MNAPQHAHPTPVIAPRPMPAEIVDALRARFGDRCSTAMAVRELHGRDESPFDVPPPDAVVYCESNQDVIDAVRLADRFAVPVITVESDRDAPLKARIAYHRAVILRLLEAIDGAPK